MPTQPTNTQHVTTQDLANIQGNLAGFNKDHQRLLFLSFPSQAAGKALLVGLAGNLNSAAEVKAFNDTFKARRAAGENPLSEPADWANLGLSGHGLSVLQAAGLDAFTPEFIGGMRARSAANGDVDDSDPSHWLPPFATGTAPIDAILIVAADLPDLLEDRTVQLRAIITASGVAELLPAQDGNVLPGPLAGHEHFGFKDGISQPSILGLVHSSRGGDEVAAGEFLVGYEDETGAISGNPVGEPSRPLVQGETGYPGSTPGPGAGLPDWARNGSFLVYRRLRQNVGGFRSFIGGQPAGPTVSPDQLAAKMVGRWPSGAPLEHVPGEPAGTDTTTVDPSVACPAALEDDHLNNFGFHTHDQDGHLTPKAAHIRKVYPRDSEPPGEDGPAGSSHHRILRRGVPYGNPFSPTEPAYGAVVPADQDRGLLFLCYQSSLENGFEFIQQQWVNKPNFPEAGAGQDPIISQNVEAPPFPLPSAPALTTVRWVTTTGGEYFFSPSLSAIGKLAQ